MAFIAQQLLSFDASWTLRGNIAYMAYNIKKVVVISEFGIVFTKHMHIKHPLYLSVSNDFIYLTDNETGVNQSTDDLASWSLVFESTDRWHCWLVIKITADRVDDFWTL